MEHAEFGTCIEACRRCAEECEDWSKKTSHGAQAGKRPEFITLTADCGQLCRTTAGFLERESQFIDEICATLAQVCDAVVEAGERRSESTSQRCLEACRDCANECRRVLAIHAT
jgi:hypothetical protein